MVDDCGCECAEVPWSRSNQWKAMERACKVSKAVRPARNRHRKDSLMEGAVEAAGMNSEVDADADC